MKAHQKTVGKSDAWITPREIWSKLGRFDVDPACPDFIRDPIAPCCYTRRDDGLRQKWFGRVWLNPPFNRYERPKWMAKMAQHGNGIMLVPAATENKAFFDYVWSRADAVCFVRGRPHFYTPDTERSGVVIPGKRGKANCGCAIALVAYGRENVAYLEAANLGPTLNLNNEFRVARRETPDVER